MIWMKIKLLLASANSIARPVLYRCTENRKQVCMDDGSSWSVLYSKSDCVCHAFWLFMHPTDAQSVIIGGFH
jgi:hypothetical protein